ncbi:MAG TPA: FAD-dependent oxidoreductase [Candidatus Aminicenantes bacterium]|nr:FAD-dependent oxidoreductase [Candidatus Aminicenantes bacterium]
MSEEIGSCDVAVIGGGPAGLAAALGARRAGAGRVLLLERERALGGILNQCVHDGFGLFLYKETISGPEYAERLAEDVGRETIEVETGAMVLDLTAGRVLRINSRAGYRLVRAGAVVLAMGCRERTRDQAGIPGTRPAGVYTAGLAQNLVNLRNLRVGSEAVILGSGDIGLIMARRLIFEGIAVKGVFEIMPWAGGLERNVRQCLMDFGIPLELGSTVVEIRGRDRVESVVVAKVDEALAPVAGTERVVPCDTLLLSVGLIPENELSKRAGVELSPLTGGAVVDETLMTSVPGVFSCGNVLHIHDVADWASFEGFAAGENAARYAARYAAEAAAGDMMAGEKTAEDTPCEAVRETTVRGKAAESPRERMGIGKAESRPSGTTVRVTTGPLVKYALPQIVTSGTAGVEWSFRVTRPARDVRVEVRGKDSGKIYAGRKFPRLLPSELQKIKVKEAVGEDLEVGGHE